MSKNEEKQKSKASKDEEKVLDFWEKNEIFQKSVEKGAPKGEYIFYDGPPFATGLPHYGHFVASIMKDAVPRYWTMKGYRVRRRWGWDCHGLPVENLAEKELELKNRKDIENFGIGKFNNYCESIVLRYAKEWKSAIKRIGRWVDMENDYKTMDTGYTESVWWVFKSLWDKNLIYKSYKPMHICGRCGTTLSNFEVGLGYKDIKDISVVANFKLTEEDETYVLAWTTTPWTLIGNVALAIGEKLTYLVVSIDNKKYILAKERAEEVLEGEDWKKEKEMKGKDLIGKSYEPLFDYYFKNNDLENKENGWKIYAGDFVTTDEGTGIVHIAPSFGEDDMNMKKKYELPFIQHVDIFGRFKEEVVDFAGMEVKPKDDHTKTDVEIIKYLAHNNFLFKKKKYEHSYPHCWRCETPLLNYAAESWYVSVTSIKEDLIKNNQEVNWVPEHVKNGRFGKWIEGARDWCISRNRYWGAPLPVWECQEEDCDEKVVAGSISDLEKLSGEKIVDLHRPNIDKVTFSCKKCKGKMKRIEEVLDCWFESGSMPYAQMNYTGKPLEDFDPETEKNFPAQFVAEGMDQTRGWFYTLMVLSTALFNKKAFENVIVNGIILAEDGQKMSKSKANYPDPMLLVDKFGADAIRQYLLSSPVLVGENLNFSENGVLEVLRKNIMLVENILTFYFLFAEKNSSFKDKKIEELELENVLDKWIISRFCETVREIDENMSLYKIPPACNAITIFIDDFSTWYIRRSRERFKEKRGKDFERAVDVTGFVLTNLSKAMAPIMPFIAEKVWQEVTGNDFKNSSKSVHLESFPGYKDFSIEESVLSEMKEVRETVSLALKERAENGIKVRQPLSEAKINSSKIEKSKNKEEYLRLIKDEINVKKVIFGKNLELNTTITDELREEGHVREIIRTVQNLRKQAELVPDEKIDLFYEGDIFENIFLKWKDFIKKETGAKDIIKGVKKGSFHQKEVLLGEEKIIIAIKIIR